MQKARSKVAKSIRIVRAAAAFALAIAIAISARSAMAQELQITSPTTGTTAVPSQTVTITVQVAAGASFPSGVSIIGSDPLGGAGPVTVAPYSLSLTIPAGTAPGPYIITAIGIDSTGALTASTPITLQIEPASAPTSINVLPTQVVLSAIGASASLHVIATFPDSSTADVTEDTNMSYTPADPTIVSAGPTGTITAVGAGTTTVDVKYAPGGGSLEVSEPAGVLTPIISPSPVTLNFSAVPQWGSSTPQTDTVTNSGNSAVSFFGVSATGDFGETDNCVSGSPIDPAPAAR